jgi:hypothetical protein
MTELIAKLFSFGRFSPKKEDFFGMSAGEKNKIFKKIIREANKEQLAVAMSQPKKFEELKKSLNLSEV